MITLRKCNFFTGTANNVSNAVSKIVKFLELDGYNHLLITPPNSSGSKDTNTGINRSLPGYLDIKYIILAKEFEYKESEDVSDYHVEVKYSDSINFTSLSGSFKSEIFLSDEKNGWKSTLDSLKTSYIRDKKIDSLFDDENE